jgi:hypothetical protein
VDVPDPVPKVQDLEPLLLGRARRRQQRAVLRDRRDDAVGGQRAGVVVEPVGVAGQVDVVLRCPSPWMIGPVQASANVVNSASRRIIAFTRSRAVPFSSWKAISQITRWPRSPQARAGPASRNTRR